MANELGLDRDEIVILREDNIDWGKSLQDKELVLTNKKIICLCRGAFGGIKQIYHFPLDQIKFYNGVPQVKYGRSTDGLPSLDVYFLDGEEQFGFQLGKKRVIRQWIEEIDKLFGVSYVPEEEQSTSNADGTLFGVFKEVGAMYKDIGRGFAESLGFKGRNREIKANDSTSIQKSTTIHARSIPNQVDTGTGMKCPSCGKYSAKGSKFCSFCGSPMTVFSVEKKEIKERICPTCGKKVKPDMRFCTECGTEVGIINNN